jgi:hypothetical protein
VESVNATEKGATVDVLVGREDVWAASVDDKAGALGAKLSALSSAGADLDFIIVRRAPENPGTGVVFVTPLRGDQEVQAATAVGFAVTSSLHSLRVEGPNEPGVAATITRMVGDAGINMRGFSSAVIGPRYVAHISVESVEEQDAVIRLLSGL